MSLIAVCFVLVISLFYVLPHSKRTGGSLQKSTWLWGFRWGWAAPTLTIRNQINYQAITWIHQRAEVTAQPSAWKLRKDGHLQGHGSWLTCEREDLPCGSTYSKWFRLQILTSCERPSRGLAPGSHRYKTSPRVHALHYVLMRKIQGQAGDHRKLPSGVQAQKRGAATIPRKTWSAFSADPSSPLPPQNRGFAPLRASFPVNGASTVYRSSSVPLMMFWRFYLPVLDFVSKMYPKTSYFFWCYCKSNCFLNIIFGFFIDGV